MNNFFVKVIAYEKDEVVKTMGPYSERKAEKIEDGLLINLNHEDYYTDVVEGEE